MHERHPFTQSQRRRRERQRLDPPASELGTNRLQHGVQHDRGVGVGPHHVFNHERPQHRALARAYRLGALIPLHQLHPHELRAEILA